jgi:CRISPR-associated protein Csa3
MRTYVSTLGFHETRVTRPVIKHGLDEGDRVVLVRPAEEGNSKRATDAVGYVEDMVEEIEPGATVTVERVDAAEFTTAVLQCSDILVAIDREREVIVNFGGGAREVLLPLLIGAVLHAPLVDRAFQYTDVDQEVRELSVPNLTAQIPSNAVDTFELIATFDGEITLPDLAGKSDRSKSTIGRHVDELADVDVIRTRMETNTKYISLSQTGEFVYRAGRVTS